MIPSEIQIETDRIALVDKLDDTCVTGNRQLIVPPCRMVSCAALQVGRRPVCEATVLHMLSIAT